jgi:putative PIG3 family NAD(P)H quinone oxidoreductase
MDHEVPGMEFSGTVAALGARVTAARVGDPVMGIVGGGSYAEQLVTHERLLLPVPSTVPLADAAAIPEVYITAFDALVVQGGLTAGRTALVHAGASGVGTASIQIAKAIGADIVVTTSSGKVERCRELGADVVVDYGSEDFVAAAKEATAGRGVDVVLDVIGGDYLPRNVSAVGMHGRIIQVGVMGGGPAEINLGVVLMKKVHLIGTTLRSRPIEEKIAITRRFATEILPFFESGALSPVIDRRFPLAEMPAAHSYLAENTSVGKVLIDVG